MRLFALLLLIVFIAPAMAEDVDPKIAEELKRYAITDAIAGGTPYDEAREVLVAAGWTPDPFFTQKEPGECRQELAQICAAFPEVSACYEENGSMLCSMEFIEPDREKLMVTVRFGRGAPTYVRRNYFSEDGAG